MAEPGFAVEFNVDPQGSELDQAAAATDTVLYLGDASDYDAPGTVRVDNGTVLVDIDFTASDTDADTITLEAPLGVVADVGDRVYILSGGDIAYDHTLEVHLADGEAVDIDVDYAERVLWEPGPVEPPVPVLVSDDLTSIVDVPGRRALVNPFSSESPLFVGYRATDLTLSSSTTYSTITGWVTKVLRGGMQYDTGTSSVVVPLSGWYSVSDSAVMWRPNLVGKRGVQPSFNTAAGVVPGGEYRQDASDDPVIQTTPVASPLTALEAGETASLTAFQNSGSSLAIAGNTTGTVTFFSVEYRGPL